MQTLKEKYPNTHQVFVDNGLMNLATLLDKVNAAVSLDRLMGTQGSASNWMLQKNLPSSKWEYKAREILKAMKDVKDLNVVAQAKAQQTEMDLVDQIENVYTSGPRQTTPEIPKTNDTLKVVVIPEERTDQVTRLLERMGCMVEDL